MGFDALEIAVFIKEGAIFTVRTCYRSVRNHPFVLGMLFFFIFLSRYFPAVFAFLISSSPVLVCTAVLLGTLLSFGKPNIPEIEKKEKSTHEIVSLKTGVVERDLVVQKDENCSVETHVEKRRDSEDKAVEDSCSAEGREAKASEVDEDDVLVCGSSLIAKELKETHGEKRVIEEENGILESELVHNREFHEETPLMEGVSFSAEDDRSSECQKKGIEDLKEGNDKPSGESLDMNLDDRLESPRDSSCKQVDDHGESSDYGSDCTESSSPDASLADIIPMLDELHPLLDSEAPQPALVSLDDSDAASERSHRSKLDEESENQEEVEEEEEEEKEKDDDDDEEEGKDGNDDRTKSVVTWTEDDEKNLMDLGTSELERNQRLENLIARRRARRFLRMEAEKNLIDFESIDPPFNITSISTRRNPFDLPYDSNESMGLPPIPGSAPSVLLPRRNPFDLPYDPNEEKPNLKEDSFQEEFMTHHQKDMFFRRHESFSMGFSFSGEFKQEKHDFKFRPYFVTERMSQEGTGFPTFLRQFSDRSDSKISSVPETESISSPVDQEQQKKLIQQELSEEIELISGFEFASKDIGHESQSSEEVEVMEVDQEAKRDIDLSRFEGMDGENAHETESSLSDAGSIASPPALNKSEIHIKTEVVEDEYSESTSALSSEVNEKIFHKKADKDEGNLERKNVDFIERTDSSLHSPLKELGSNSTSEIVDGVDDSQIKEPVYDSSPSAIEKSLSNMTTIEDALFYVNKGVLTSTSSISSDLQVEISEMGSPIVPVVGTVLFVDVESAVHDRSIEKEMTSGSEGFWAASSHLFSVDENESRMKEVTEISELDVINVGFLVDQKYDDLNAPLMPESVAEKTESEEEGLVGGEANLQFEQDEVRSSNFNAGVNIRDIQDVEKKFDPVSSTFGSSDDKTSSGLEKQLTSVEKFMIQTSSVGILDEHQELAFVLDKSIEEANIVNHVSSRGAPDLEERDLSNHSPLNSVPACISLEDSEDKCSTDLIDLKGDAADGIKNSGQSWVLEHINDMTEAIGLHATEEKSKEEVDGIKDIDEGFLSELDRVGDFRANEIRSNVNQIEEELRAEGESPHQQQGFEFTSIEGIEADFNRSAEFKEFVDPVELVEAGLRFPNLKDDDKHLDEKESISDIHSFGTRSLEDKSLSFKDSVHGDVEKPIIPESIHEEPMQNKNESWSAEYEIANQVSIPVELKSEFTVLEAGSIGGLDSAFEQVREEVEKPIAMESLKTELAEEELKIVSTESRISERDSSLNETHLEIPVIAEKSIAIESLGTELEGEKLKVVSSELGLSERDSSLTENLPVNAEKPVAIECINAELAGEELKVMPTELDLSERDSSLTETHLELPVNSEKPVAIETLGAQLAGEELKVMSTELGLSERDLSLTETHLEIPVDAEKPVAIESLKAALMGEELKVVSTELELSERGSSLTEMHLELPVNAEKFVAIESLNADLAGEELKIVSTELGLSERDSSLTETHLLLPVLEVRSLEDIDSYIKQLHEGRDIKKPTIPEPANDSPLVVESKCSVEVDSNLQVVEARSVEDFNFPLDQLLEGKMDNLPELVESKDIADIKEGELEKATNPESIDSSPREIEFKEKAETHSDLLVIEATSFDDIHLALKELSEGHFENMPKQVESKQRSADKDKEGDFEKFILPESIEEGPSVIEFKDSEEFRPDLQVGEGKHLEDIHMTLKQPLEVHMQKFPKPLEYIDGSTEVVAKEVESAEEIDSNFEESSIRESVTTVEESQYEVKETSKHMV